MLVSIVLAVGLLSQAAAGRSDQRASDDGAATGDPVARLQSTPPGGFISTAVVTAVPEPPPQSTSEPEGRPLLPISTIDPEQPPAATPPPAPPPDDAEIAPSVEPTLPALPPPPDADTTPSERLLPCNAAAPLSNPPRFLSLPFPPDPQMEVFQGWKYTHNRHPQCGIDFGKRSEQGALVGFPVLASADGEACGDHDGGGGCVSGFGDRVLIRHTVEGQIYYTYYGHLASISPNIPMGSRSTTVRVRRGEVIGYAGDTGTWGGSIHLHYGIAAPSFGWYDPYDLWTTAEVYPDPLGLNGMFSGSSYFWTTNPPSSDAMIDTIGGVEASLPADVIAAGTMNVAAWTEILGRETGVIEIWIDGERRGEADFGPAPEASNSTFTWEWDTTRERNGPHTVVLRAFAEDSRIQPQLSATESQEATFLVTIQNPWGFVNSPRPAALVVGTLPISGWVTVEESNISEVEIWVDGQKRGTATYGLPHEGAGGNYGFVWDWDTTRERDGTYTIIVKAFAANGGHTELPSVYDITQTVQSVTIHNGSLVPKWSIR